MGNSTTKLCLECNSEFVVTSKHPNTRYCNLKCSASAKKKREIRHCLQCDGAFETTVGNDRRFCTSICANRYNQPPDPTKHTTVKCVVCGAVFEAWVSRKATCCSRKCASKLSAGASKPKARRPENLRTLYCEHCNKEYVVHVAQVTGRRSRFCSTICRDQWLSENRRGANNPNYVGGTKFPNRGSSWSRQRKLAKLRDGARCQICGTRDKKRRIAVHHIIPYRIFEGDHLTANELPNLITLCQKCHGKVEHHKLPCPRRLL